MVPTGRLLRRGLRAHCPLCGSGHVFTRWLRMAPTCPGCGLRFERAEGHWLGSWFLNVCVTQVAVTAAIVAVTVLTWPDLDAVMVVGVAAVVAVVVPLAFFPASRMVWTAIDLAMRPLSFDDGVPPGWALDHAPPRAPRRAA